MKIALDDRSAAVLRMLLALAVGLAIIASAA